MSRFSRFCESSGSLRVLGSSARPLEFCAFSVALWGLAGIQQDPKISERFAHTCGVWEV